MIDYSDGKLPVKGSEADLLRAIMNLMTEDEIEGFLSEIAEYHDAKMADLFLQLMYDWGIWAEPRQSVEQVLTHAADVVGLCDLCGEEHADPIRYS